MVYNIGNNYIACLHGRAWLASSGETRAKYPIYSANKRATKKRVLQSLRDRGVIK